MKIIKLIIFSLVPLTLFAQRINDASELLLVEYSHTLHMEGLPRATIINAYLSMNERSSLYEMDFLNNKDFINEEDSENGAIMAIKPKVNDFIFKDFKNKSTYSTQRVEMRPFIVKDSDTVFNWKIHKETKEVIGYNCQKATVDYRGRSYVAFFTTQIPFVNGPWKFGNLPGLILEVYSIDNVFNIKANKLQIKNAENIIDNPFETKNEKSITWNQFLTEYKRKYNQLKYYRSSNGGTSSIPVKGIETYIED
jgi:GLPGLI family protein